MTQSITIEGADDLIRELKKLGEQADAELAKIVQATAIEVRGDIIKRYQRGPKTGVIRQRGTITHQASAPGEAPATDTGRLANGTQYKMTGRTSAEVSNAVQYGPWLEFGTQDIEPRPAWRPAVEAATPKYRSRMETALARIINNAN